MTDIFLYSGEVIPTDIVLSDPTTTRGDVTITGTGDETAPVGLLAAQALEVFVAATGDETAPVGVLAGTAAEVFAASGGETAAVGLLSGTAAEVFVATGSETAPVGELSAAGAEIFASDGSETAPVAQIEAIGDAGGGTTITGTAEMSAMPAGLDGVGFRYVSQRPYLQAQQAARQRRQAFVIRGTAEMSTRHAMLMGRGSASPVVAGAAWMTAPQGTLAAVGRQHDEAVALWLLDIEDIAA
jgi:hypothetical protein